MDIERFVCFLGVVLHCPRELLDPINCVKMLLGVGLPWRVAFTWVVRGQYDPPSHIFICFDAVLATAISAFAGLIIMPFSYPLLDLLRELSRPSVTIVMSMLLCSREWLSAVHD